MRKSSVAESVLSLFTSPDRATCIAGDLTEEGRSRSWFWFWSQIARVATSLFAGDLRAAPVRLASLLFLGAILSQVGLHGIAPFLTQALGSFAGAILWGRLIAPFLIGLVLARLSPGREMTTCAPYAIAGEFVLLAYWVAFASHGYNSPINKYFIGIQFLSSVPILSAGAVARYRFAR